MAKYNGLFILGKSAFDAVYAPRAYSEIQARVDVLAPPLTPAAALTQPGLLREMDLLFSGWGAPKVDTAFLRMAPRLKAIFYGAGAINGWATPALWERGILVTTANDANAIPVAEYTVSTILFSLKHGWRLSCGGERTRGFQIRTDVPGNYNSVIGLIGLGTIAKMVVRMLEPFRVSVVAFDPFVSAAEALRVGVTKVSLEELFEQSDVVSLHAPDLPATHGMVNRPLLERMKCGATLINTSRGRLICEADLAAVLRQRSDLQAVLDVTEKEPLPPDSPLNGLDNLVLTPHIAGSQGRECQRLGQYMVDELDRYLAGVPLEWQVQPTEVAHSVHAFVSPELEKGRQFVTA